MQNGGKKMMHLGKTRKARGRKWLLCRGEMCSTSEFFFNVPNYLLALMWNACSRYHHRGAFYMDDGSLKGVNAYRVI